MYNAHINHMAYDTASSADLSLTRAVSHIKQAQQIQRQELDKKDEKIQQLERKLERLQSENRELTLEFTEFKRLNDKDNNHYRDMLSNNHYLEQELTMEKSRNEELRLELSMVRQELKSQESKVSHLELEHEKANHIIRTLVKKVQSQQQQQQLHQHPHQRRSPLMTQSASTSAGNNPLHGRLVT